MRKDKRSIVVDPEVWRGVLAAARERRVSASWVSETALREWLARSRRESMRREKPPIVDAVKG